VLLPVRGRRKKDYHINDLYSDKDECYIADLKYGSALGATPEEALREVIKAKKAWLKAAKSAANSLAKYRPAICQG
jgi:hypothetical protein